MKGKRKKEGMKATGYRLWFVLNIIFSCIYLIWRLFFTIPFEFGMVSIVAGITLFVVEFLGLLEALVHYFNMHDVTVKELPVIPVEMYPDVDVFIATYNEPCSILYKTVNGCNHMAYPDKKKVHIYLCDDGSRDEVKKLAAKMGVGYIEREEHENAKAGNLNNALSVTSSPYIVTFDADMIPHSNFLMHTIPYFIGQEIENEGKEEEDQVHFGFVQTPQAFYNPDLFQFNLYSEGRIPNEQDYFYRDIQVSRNKSNSVIYGGSNTVLSRRALEDIGGFFDKTITEDYGTGILMQKKGYIGYATSEVLASGLSPTDLKSLVDQRIRWARGVITTNRKLHVILSRHLSFAQKVNYWASEWYWFAPFKRLVYFISPILYATFGYMVIKCTLWQILLFWLPMYITSNVSLRLLSRSIRTTKWTNIYETVLFPFLLVPVFLETIGIKMKKFKVTKKGDVENERGKNLLYLIPFILLVILSVIGIFNCFGMIFESNDMGPLVVLFWLFLNLFTLVMAMFFVLGRDFMRKSERASVVADCEINTQAGKYTAKTINISEDGIAVKMLSPVNIDDKEDAEIRLWTEKYKAVVKAKVVHVDNRKKEWIYAFHINDYCDTQEEFLQILFDRVPTLPQKLDTTSGGFDDLRLNVTKRAVKPFYENRQYPRVEVDVLVQDEKGRKWRMLDFNYKYCTLYIQQDAPETLKLTINKKKGVYLNCVSEREKTQERLLYRIENYEEIYADNVKNEALEAWVYNEWKEAAKKKEERKKSVKEETVQTEFDEMNHV